MVPVCPYAPRSMRISAWMGSRCALRRPHGVTVARDGTLFITDSYNDRVLKIVP